MSQFQKYLSLITFSHTIFAMPFAILGMVIGMDQLDWNLPTMEILRIAILVILAMVTARSAAMAFNRYLDADIDAQNERTKNREIPAGIISKQKALRFTIIMSIGFMLISLAINKLCFFLSPIALFVILFYSYTKRFTALCHLVLGLGLALAPIGAYIAVRQSIDPGVIFLGLSVLLWVGGFDIIYSLQDRDFDDAQSLHSIPVYLGTQRSILLSRILHVLSLASLGFAMYSLYGTHQWIITAAWIFFAAVLLYQHSLYTAKDLSRVNKKYLTTNGVASLVFCLMIVIAIFTGV